MSALVAEVPGSSMASALAQLHASIDGVAGHADRLKSEVYAGASSASPPGITGALRSVERASRRLESVKLTLIATLEKARAAEADGHSSTAAMVGQVTGSGGAAAAAQVSLAAALEDSCPQSKEALARGDLTSAAAAIIAGTMDKLPDGLTDDERSKVEAALVKEGKQLAPGRFRRSAARALAAAEKSAEDVDAHHDEQLRSQEERAYAASTLTMHDNGDGTTTGRFVVPTLAASMLRKIIQAMVSPRRDHLRSEGTGQQGGHGSSDRSTGASFGGDREPVTGPAWDSNGLGGDRSPGSAPAWHRDADWKDLSWQAKAGRALVDLLEHLPTDHLSASNAATVVITAQLEALLGALRAASVETGMDLSAGEARRLACNAGLMPLILGGASLPLDLGRRQRFFTPAQRTALASIYDSCAEEGCDRPYSWCELHHEKPWQSGGRTSLANAIPLCGFHHRLIDSPRFGSTVTRDGPKATVRFVRRQ